MNLSTGTAFVTTPWAANFNSSTTDPGRNIVADINGDGLSDIVSYVNSTTVKVHISTGSGFVIETWTAALSNGPRENHAADIDGDGRTDIISRYGNPQVKVHRSTAAFPDLLGSITTNLGGKIEVAYKPLTDSTVYTKGTGAVYPVMDIQPAMYVVDSHTARNQGDANGQNFTFTYDYGGVKYHHLGRGGLGFAWTRTVDETAGATVINNFKQVNPTTKLPDFPFIGMLESSQTLDAGGNLFAQVTNEYEDLDTQPTQPKVRFPAQKRTVKDQCDGQALCLKTAATSEYDRDGPGGKTFGNLIHTFHEGDTSITGDERHERTEWVFSTAGTNWLHRPTHTRLLDSTDTVVTREKWVYYDDQAYGVLSTRGLVTKEESSLTGIRGDAANPTVTYTYDGFGNRISTTDPLGCQTATTVETLTKTFPATVTRCFWEVSIPENPTPQTTSFTWDPRFGAKLTETDPNLQTSTFTFDGFGRPTKVVGPLDSPSFPSVTLDYLDWGDPQFQSIKTSKRKDHGRTAVVVREEFFDGLGRFDFIKATGPNDPATGQARMIVEDSVYDSRGLVTSKKPARFEGETPLPPWEYTYDVLGRQTRADHPDNRFSRTIYEPGKVTTIDERGVGKTKHLDAYGRVIEIDEKNNGGADTYTTSYEYDTAGSLVRVTNALGHHTRIKYDALGRKLAMCDPNMGAGPNTTTCETNTPGAWVYSYDKAGNLRFQTDAKNQQLEFRYDLLGRQVKKIYPDAREINFTFDDVGVQFSKGRLTRVDDLNAMVATFVYDRVGRVTQTQRTIDGYTYTMSQTYNALSKVTSEMFPDLDSANYTYDEAGWLKSVGGYVNQILYNARGQKDQIDYANGVTTTFDYYDQNPPPVSGQFINFALENRTTAGPGGTLQNLSYDYDEVMNVKAVVDAVFTGNRNFDYDDLSRLVSASGTFGGTDQSQVTQAYAYDAVGNILTKAGITYSYDPNRPSFVTSTSDGKTYTADPNGNTLTGAGRSFAWTADNRVESVTMGGTTAMDYDYTGQRVKKYGPLGQVLYPFAGYEIGPDGTKTKFFRAGNELLAAKQSPVVNPEKKLFYHNDHLGGVNVISDITGNRIQLTEYEPWGKVSRNDPATNSPDPEKRFTGQILDPESGLYYYGARYYDPDLARFISPDPIVPSPGDPQSLNRYSYVRNNPVKYIDPTGHSFWSSIGNLFSGFFRSMAGKIAGFAIAQWLGGPLGQILGSIASRIVNSAMSGGGFGLNSFTGGFSDGIMSSFTQAATGGGGGDGGEVSGSTGQLYRVDLEGKDVAGYNPASSVTTGYLAINGVRQNLDDAMRDMAKKVLAVDSTVSSFTLYHNPTEGAWADFLENFRDKLGFTTPIARDFAGVLQGVQASGQEVRIVAYSQGGAILSEAARIAGGSLSNITGVQCYGCANNEWVSGQIFARAGITNVNYTSNFFDAVPNIVGLNGNPARIVGSVLAAPWLFTNSSPHTYP